MNKKLIAALRREFVQRLQAKTGWGRNEVLNAFDEAVGSAALALLDEAGDQDARGETTDDGAPF